MKGDYSMQAEPAKPAGEVKYLTPKEVSKRFREISTRTLSNWRCLGTGPKYTKIGGRILYPLDELEAWERGRTVNSTSSYGQKTVAA